MEESPKPLPPHFDVTERCVYLAKVHMGTTLPLLALTLIPFCARIYIRLWPKWRFWWDDVLIVAGLACAVTDWVLLERQMYFTPQQLPTQEALTAVIYAYFAIPVWSFAMSFIKTSVVLTLLRLPLRRAMTAVLYVLLTVQIGYGVGNAVYLFAKCRPHHSAWDFTVERRHCPSEQTDMLVSSLGSGINIASDAILSLAPMAILWHLRRPLRERILICVLTGMGLITTVCSVLKAVAVADWTRDNDRCAASVAVATWTVAEQFVSVLAACSPSLKQPIERLMDRLGVPLVEHNSRISFVHIRSRIREEQLRRQTREWLGEDESRIIGGDVDLEAISGVRGEGTERDATRDDSVTTSASKTEKTIP